MSLRLRSSIRNETILIQLITTEQSLRNEEHAAIMTYKYKIIVAFLMMAATGIDTSAAYAQSFNIDILWRLLAPADLMLMVGNACVSQDPSFLTRTTGKHGDFRAYAQEVKDEVSEGVPPEDLHRILRLAADAAKTEALAEVRDLGSSDPQIEAGNMRRWCITSATQIIAEFIQVHDQDHEGFEKLLAAAKTPRLNR